MKGKVIFNEEQRFVNTWMWYLVIGMAALLIGGVILAFTTQIEDEGLVGLIIAAIVAIGVVALLSNAKLLVSVDHQAIYYRFPPFISIEKRITKDNIKEMYVRKYRPIWEYGGHGPRFRFRSGRSVSVNGNQGLQLVLSNGKRLLIGTQKPEALKHAIQRLKGHLDG